MGDVTLATTMSNSFLDNGVSNHGGQPRAIHQLVHTLSYGDAISTEVLALQRSLLSHGIVSEIYAINVHPKYVGRARSYTELPSSERADLLLHYSLGSPLNQLYREWRGGRRSLVYHNITPPKYFRSINDRVADDIEAGLADLPALCALSDTLIADSRFNASELQALGFSSEVLELPIDPGRWDLPRNEGLYSIVNRTPGLHLLHVGRLAPNKQIEDIIKTFYFLHYHVLKTGCNGTVPRQSKLWLVGIDTDTELYSYALKRLVDELRLTHAVEFVGCLADEEVRALYEACSVYLGMSEHEGFCLPLIEAMHFGLPVVAYGAGAVADTVGTGGVVVSEKRHAEIAELVAELGSDTPLRQRMIEAGKKRMAAFSFENFSRRVGEVIVAPAREPLRVHG